MTIDELLNEAKQTIIVSNISSVRLEAIRASVTMNIAPLTVATIQYDNKTSKIYLQCEGSDNWDELKA